MKLGNKKGIFCTKSGLMEHFPVKEVLCSLGHDILHGL